MSAFGAPGTIWTVGLSVLGIYVYKRSQEKQAPFVKANGFQALSSRFNRGG